MSDSVSTQSDLPKNAGALIDAPQGGETNAEQSSPNGQRVIELPAPPKVADDLPLSPEIETGESSSSGWRRWWSRVGRRQSSSCLVSCLVHCGLLITAAMIVQAVRPETTSGDLVFYTNEPAPLTDPGDDLHELFVVKPDRLEGGPSGMPQPLDVPRIDRRDDGAANPTDSRQSAIGLESAQPTDWLQRVHTVVGGDLSGRGREARAALALGEGGSKQSEGAVERGLRWLMAHQRQDGSWNFDHHKSPCRGECRNPGSEASTTGATAMALLAFLGAGYTHNEGEYRDVVKRGLYYLGQRTLTTRHGDDLQEGTMYAQGLAAIVLCEAYAMTKDPALRPRADGAIRFILYAQDVKGGGWRYTPGEPGDTTVTGWQLMALKSGQMAGLEVPSSRIYLVRQFLDAVQYDDGAQYGYLDPQPRQTTTAIGLLCRMYTGWGRDRPALERGVAHLSEWGPSDDNIYYNYYATQVMRHFEGPPWEKWNEKMRENLIATQAKSGHENGSWHFGGGRGKVGGRLYNTAMAVMTLEVYYRYLPLYRERSIAGEF